MPRVTPSDLQCVFVENGRRCRRNGSGTPSVCKAHQIAFAKASAPPARGDAIRGFFEDLVSGGRPSKKKQRAAFNDLRDIVRDYTESQQARPAPPRPHRHASPAAHVPHEQEQQRPPPRRESVAEANARFLNAKKILGFAESEPITAEMVKDRRRQLAKKFHPDLHPGEADKLSAINAAADELLRPRAA